MDRLIWSTEYPEYPVHPRVGKDKTEFFDEVCMNLTVNGVLGTLNGYRHKHLGWEMSQVASSGSTGMGLVWS